MGQDASKAAADMGDKMKDALLRLAERVAKKDSDGGGKKTKRDERRYGCRGDNWYVYSSFLRFPNPRPQRQTPAQP
jgi:hypothetical protein